MSRPSFTRRSAVVLAAGAALAAGGFTASSASAAGPSYCARGNVCAFSGTYGYGALYRIPCNRVTPAGSTVSVTFRNQKSFKNACSFSVSLVRSNLSGSRRIGPGGFIGNLAYSGFDIQKIYVVR